MICLIYVTGDVHGELDISKLNNSKFKAQKDMTKSDYLIVAGDFGLLFSGTKQELYLRNELNNRKFTTLWVDGNHENFDMLERYPVTEWCGGKVHQIDTSIIHLMRGQVYEIDGQKVFTMGGAASIDAEWRTEGLSWWSQELPNVQERDEARRNLEANNNQVDYVITHTAPSNIVNLVTLYPEKAEDPSVVFLDEVQRKVKFDRWYFGHFHVDANMGNYTALYNSIVPIGSVV